jgi:hypothetical protein
MKGRLVLVACTLLLAGFDAAADSFREVEYISGKAGFAKKVKGQLTIDEKEVSFTDQKGKTLFSIPVAEIDKAEAGTQREEGSFGRKMALGIFASKTEEYLHIESHNDAGAEAVVFKVKKKTGPGMAAKVMFWAGKAKASAAPAAATTEPPPPPPPTDPPPTDPPPTDPPPADPPPPRP